MKAHEFISQLEEQTLLAAIREVETHTTAELRVMISTRQVDDALRSAWDAFARLGMDKTAARNGVLIFIAPAARRFAIIGDEAIHRLCGSEHWEAQAARLSAGFKANDFTGSLVAIVQDIGRVLAQHFPGSCINANELPDDVVRE
jgi:uncharacterized membrane protein